MVCEVGENERESVVNTQHYRSLTKLYDSPTQSHVSGLFSTSTLKNDVWVAVLLPPSGKKATNMVDHLDRATVSGMMGGICLGNSAI
jgi:hypothetical protein